MNNEQFTHERAVFMAKKCNLDIRERAADGGFKLWELAAQTGISCNTLTMWLRFPLEGERLERVTKALEELERK